MNALRPIVRTMLLLALSGCTLGAPALPEPPDDWGVYELESRQISESSGLVRSRRHAGVFWTHNDSGDSPRIFAVDARGRLLGEYPVRGASARDWEDIAIDDAGHLYLGDIGNNANARRDLVVYRVPEPDPARDREARVDRVLRYRYTDQTGFPEQGNRIFDAEALFWREGDLYLFTKHRTDPYTKLYHLPTTAFEGERALEPIARFEVGESRPRQFGNTTAADVTPDGERVALLSYSRILLYRASGRGDTLALEEVRRIELDSVRTLQVESICWDDGALVFGNEQRKLFRIPDPFAPGLARYSPPD